MESKKLANFLQKNFSFFSGVPDSLLSKLTKKLSSKKIKHFIAANEGSAIAHGIGYYLAKKKVPCVYFQNSGLGNAINPIISIAHKNVYSIPLFLIIGWRGSKESKDEPQHMAKGTITPDILKLLGVKYFILKKDDDTFNLKKLKFFLNLARKKNIVVACLVKKDIIKDKTNTKKKQFQSSNFSRALFIEHLLKKIKKNTKIISTTGYTSRELFQIRKNKSFKKGKDFYMVGGMGHSSSVALGYNIFSKGFTICLDGDGSLIMHLGSIIACTKYSKNFKYILINNNSHESVGGQTTNSNIINFEKFSSSVGFDKYVLISNLRKIDKKIDSFLKSKGKVFLEIKTKPGSLKNLERPKKLLSIKNNFASK